MLAVWATHVCGGTVGTAHGPALPSCPALTAGAESGPVPCNPSVNFFSFFCCVLTLWLLLGGLAGRPFSFCLLVLDLALRAPEAGPRSRAAHLYNLYERDSAYRYPSSGNRTHGHVCFIQGPCDGYSCRDMRWGEGREVDHSR